MKTKPWFPGGLSFALLLIACGSGPGDGSPGQGGSSGQNQECKSCEESSCGAAQDACVQNPSCLDIGSCVVSCEGGDCIDTCAKANPEGAADFYGILQCTATHCAEPCAYTPGSPEGAAGSASG